MTASASWPAARAFHRPSEREPVGVDVLRCAFELGERRDLSAGVLGGRMVDLEEQGLVRLDDERAVGHGVHSLVGRRRPMTG